MNYESKQKVEISIKEVSKATFEGQYGEWYLIEYISEDGQTFFYKGSSPIKFYADTFYKIKATIKVDSYRGTEQVLLQRMNFVDKSIMVERQRVHQEKIDKANAERERVQEERNRLQEERNRVNLLKIDNEYQTLIGKTISASGWHYDNGGSMFGVINEVKQSKYSNDVTVFVDNTDKYNSMKQFSFTFTQLDTLLSKGKLAEPNRMLNTGTAARIINK